MYSRCEGIPFLRDGEELITIGQVDGFKKEFHLKLCGVMARGEGMVLVYWQMRCQPEQGASTEDAPGFPAQLDGQSLNIVGNSHLGWSWTNAWPCDQSHNDNAGLVHFKRIFSHGPQRMG